MIESPLTQPTDVQRYRRDAIEFVAAKGKPLGQELRKRSGKRAAAAIFERAERTPDGILVLAVGAIADERPQAAERGRVGGAAAAEMARRRRER
jgi:hypothetical protein